MKQLEADFLESNPNGRVTTDPDLTKIEGTPAPLVLLEEPYALIDCTHYTKESREFIYSVLNYLTKPEHYLALSVMELRMLNRRLRIMTSCRVRYSAAGRYSVIMLRDSYDTRRGFLGKDNIWRLITSSTENLPAENLASETDIDGKCLVSIENPSGEREDYLLPSEEPLTLPDGRILTVWAPEAPGVLR